MRNRPPLAEAFQHNPLAGIGRCLQGGWRRSGPNRRLSLFAEAVDLVITSASVDPVPRLPTKKDQSPCALLPDHLTVQVVVHGDPGGMAVLDSFFPAAHHSAGPPVCHGRLDACRKPHIEHFRFCVPV